MPPTSDGESVRTVGCAIDTTLRCNEHGEWRSIDELPGLEVSNLGWVRTHDGSKGGTYTEERLVAQRISGYRWFTHRGRSLSVHYCVTRAFHGPAPSPEHTPDHKKRGDGNWFRQRGDNHVDNLRWAGKSEQSTNRMKCTFRRDCIPVAIRHIEWGNTTPDMYFASTATAAEYTGISYAALAKARLHGNCASGVWYAHPASVEPVIIPGEETDGWKQYNDTLRVSRMGRAQRRLRGTWGLIFTPTPSQTKDYALISVDKPFHVVVWEAFNNRKVKHGMVIDHINRIRSDNRLSNLREVSQKINLENQTRLPTAEVQASQRRPVWFVHSDSHAWSERCDGVRMASRIIHERYGIYINTGTISRAIKTGGECGCGKGRKRTGFSFSSTPPCKKAR